MNHEALLTELAQRTISYALTGANGAFGRSLLMQGGAIPALRVAALCDLDTNGTLEVLDSLGYDTSEVRVCHTTAETRAAAARGQTVLVDDHRLLAEVELDVVVEATGDPVSGFDTAEETLRRGVHVVMVSKETDSVAGPYLCQLASENGAVYTTGDGDQPSNLCGLVNWGRALGLEIVAAGKSSEYDYVFHPDTGQVSHSGHQYRAPRIADLWSLPATGGTAELIRQRGDALAELPQSATPDYCEMATVANSTGLPPAPDGLSYPVCRVPEIADVLAPVQDGGILTRTGVVDVFNCLRLPHEPSFAGGVFIVVRCADTAVWEVLRAKGHVVARSGNHAAIYLPYHLMGVETPMTIFSAVVHGQPTSGGHQRVHAVMAARATRDINAGEVLEMGGHHHDIASVEALLLPTDAVGGDTASFYLAADATARTDIPAGTVLDLSMVRVRSEALARAWTLGREIAG